MLSVAKSIVHGHIGRLEKIKADEKVGHQVHGHIGRLEKYKYDFNQQISVHGHIGRLEKSN